MRSIFLWKNDRAGRLFIQRLMDAAERGVRVLIDDSMTESDPLYLARFGAHPNIEVRLYKPFWTEAQVLRVPLDRFRRGLQAAEPAHAQQAVHRRWQLRHFGRAQHRRGLL